MSVNIKDSGSLLVQLAFWSRAHRIRCLTLKLVRCGLLLHFHEHDLVTLQKLYYIVVALGGSILNTFLLNVILNTSPPWRGDLWVDWWWAASLG